MKSDTDVLERNWMLVPSPQLGPSTWAEVAGHLRASGQATCVPAPAMTTTADTDHLTPWLLDIAATEPPGPHSSAVVVGHSAACPRMPALVEALIGQGWPVEAMILVDGRMPDGRAFTETNPTYTKLLDGLVRPDDYLPPWPRWWGSMVEGLVVDDVARDLVFAEAKPTPRSWFDQPCPAPELPEVTKGFLSFGPGYQEARERARSLGWQTASLFGDHLHQVVEPLPVTRTLLAMVACMLDEPAQ